MKTFRAIGETRKGVLIRYQDKAKDILSFARFVQEIYPDVDWDIIFEI